LLALLLGDDAMSALAIPTADEACRLAQNLARNTNWPVLPCRLTADGQKVPARPKHLGGSGFRDATTDPDRIAWLWQYFPGELIGIASGERSGIDLLDVDSAKHEAASAWWCDNCSRLPTTRAYRSLSGGLHLFFQHATGVRCSTSRLAQGVDVRGDDGQIIFWFACGAECLDPSSPAPWPQWLLAELLPRFVPSLPPPQFSRKTPNANPNAAIVGLIRLIESATEGERNGKLNWSAWTMRQHISAGHISSREAEAALLAAALYCGLDQREALATIRSGLRASRRG
jgi:hypothetical protein